MKKTKLFAILFFIVFGATQAQNNIKEQVYLHLSESDLIVGETVHFSAFCFSQMDRKLSKLSSLLYVEVLNEQNSPVLQTKIQLKNGRGAGTFFLASDMPTGTYHVVAYTRWMRNFGDYFHQPITIVNPYKTPVKSTQNQKLAVSFYPENGQILADAENKILLTIPNYQGQKIKAKILNNNNEVVLNNLEFDKHGMKQIQLFCKTEESYQLVVDYQQKFYFYDLPKSDKNTTQISVNEKDNKFKIQLTAHQKNVNATLEILNKNGIVQSIKTTSNQTHLLDKKSIPKGLVCLQLKVNNQVKSERLFWNGSLPKSELKNLPKKIKSGTANLTVDVPKHANLSVSVKRFYGNLYASPLQNQTWTPHVKTDLDFTKFKSIDKKLLENILIASRFKKIKQSPKSVAFMPEYKQAILQGKITDWNKKKESAIILSFKEIPKSVFATKVQKDGRFYLKYDPKFANENASVFLVDKQPESNEKITFEKEFYSNYSDLKPLSLRLDSAHVLQIVKRSIANQVQNAYYRNLDSVKSLNISPKIVGFRSYILDNFTRFPSMRDTFIEYIRGVTVSKNKENFDVKITAQNSDYDDNIESHILYLIDGVLTDSESILTIPSASVKQIDVLNQRYSMAGVAFEGIISLTTFQGGANKVESAGKSPKLVEIQQKQLKIIDKHILGERIPYNSDMIYWNPTIKTNTEKLDLMFETSRIKGQYELRIEGILENGEFFSRSHLFVQE